MKIKLFARRPKYLQYATNLAFALGAAVLIWAGAGARLTQRRTFTIPLEVIPPEGVQFAFKSKTDSKISITLEGPSGTLSALSRDLNADNIHLRARLDITKEKLGGEYLENFVLDLSPTRDIELPRNLVSRLRPVSVQPGFVLLDLAPIVEREYPTLATQKGTPGRDDTVIEKLEVEVNRVVVRGSLDQIKAYEENPENRDRNDAVVARTTPIDISGASKDFTTVRAFVLPEGLTVTPEESKVTARFKRRETVDSQRLKKSFKLEVRFLVAPGVSQGQSYELMSESTAESFDIEGKKKDILAFEKALFSSNAKKRPYALIRINSKLKPGPQNGEVELGNCDPKGLTIRSGNAVLKYKVN
ncbi:MAG: hypothetical protein P1V97_11365 [Planctomycetota bacterium]|nr:hypothetical protein [Planctomycetota bacterium]